MKGKTSYEAIFPPRSVDHAYSVNETSSELGAMMWRVDTIDPAGSMDSLMDSNPGSCSMMEPDGLRPRVVGRVGPTDLRLVHDPAPSDPEMAPDLIG